MSPEEQNRVIHEFCGANKLVGLMKHGWWYRPNAQGYTGNELEAGRYTLEKAQAHEYPKPGSRVRGVTDAVTIVEFKPLDYGNDLNAIHAAEEKLTGVQREQYPIILHEVVGNVAFWLAIAHATAAQRREAFVRTIGRWKE